MENSLTLINDNSGHLSVNKFNSYDGEQPLNSDLEMTNSL